MQYLTTDGAVGNKFIGCCSLCRRKFGFGHSGSAEAQCCNGGKPEGNTVPYLNSDSGLSVPYLDYTGL